MILLVDHHAQLTIGEDSRTGSDTTFTLLTGQLFGDEVSFVHQLSVGLLQFLNPIECCVIDSSRTLASFEYTFEYGLSIGLAGTDRERQCLQIAGKTDAGRQHDAVLGTTGIEPGDPGIVK